MSTPAALSPSRVSDFKMCPLLYRFRCVDRIPEVPSAPAVKGTLVHAVLEDLYRLPSQDRVRERAMTLVEPAWEALVEADPHLSQVCTSGTDVWLRDAAHIVGQYFTVEDPTRLEPEACESRVEVTLESGTRVRGVIDRVDIAPDGRVRVVDYKTGRVPRAQFEAQTLFQLKFYALLWWRVYGVVPAVLRLVYVSQECVMEYTPHVAQLEATERSVEAVRDAIVRCAAEKHFPATPSRMCRWCPHQQICPAHGGVAPEYPGLS